MHKRIKLFIAPTRISQAEWAKVWTNILLLVQAAGFLDGGADAQKGQTYHYFCSDEGSAYPPGFESEFGIYDDIHAYRILCHDDDLGGDLLVEYFAPDRFDPTCLVAIWENAAIPRPTAFVPLLAIACLLCDRFPDAVIIDGDITADQCYRAVYWASCVLGVPISIPVIADPVRLLDRMCNENLSPLETLRCASTAYVGPRDEEWRELLKSRFCDPILYQYYMKPFFALPVSTEIYKSTFQQCLEETHAMTYPAPRTDWHADVNDERKMLERLISHLLICLRHTSLPEADIRAICYDAFGHML